jgi:hypothetical protein
MRKVFGLASAAVLAACAGTQLKEQWRDPNYQKTAAPQKVFVLAVTTRDQRRRTIEDQFVQRLRKAGADAVSSYPVLSIVGPTNMEAVKQAVQNSGATLVLTVRLVNVKQQTNVTSGGYYGPASFGGYYSTAWAGVYDPPQVYSYNIFRTEARVFDVQSDKIVWAGTLDTTEPSDFTQTAAGYADLVTKQLKDNKILG